MYILHPDKKCGISTSEVHKAKQAVDDWRSATTGTHVNMMGFLLYSPSLVNERHKVLIHYYNKEDAIVADKPFI